MTTPGVSILIPTHNRGPILDRSLQSLAEMRYPKGVEVELVVCANACTDNTHDRVMAFVGKIPNVRCVPENKTGLGHARNRCTWSSRHEICALLDDDIYVSPGWLEGLVETYRSTPAGLVAGHIELWWESIAKPDWLTPGMQTTLSCLDLGPNIVEMHTPDAIGANFSFKREVFDKVGPFRPDLDRIGNQLLGGGETFFVREALKSGFRLYYSPAASIKHWVSPHRIEAPYLTGVARGTAFSIAVMKDRFTPVDFARNMLLGGVRAAVGAVAVPLAKMSGSKGLHMQAQVRRAIGQGQWRGAWTRARRGALSPKPDPLPVP